DHRHSELLAAFAARPGGGCAASRRPDPGDAEPDLLHQSPARLRRLGGRRTERPAIRAATAAERAGAAFPTGSRLRRRRSSAPTTLSLTMLRSIEEVDAPVAAALARPPVAQLFAACSAGVVPRWRGD